MKKISDIAKNGILKELFERLGNKTTAVFGISTGLKCLALSLLDEFLFVTRDDAEAEYYAELIRSYGTDVRVLTSRADSLIYKEDLGLERISKRVEALTDIACGLKKAVISVEALKQYYERPDYFLNYEEFFLSENLSVDELIAKLVKLGYKRGEREIGTFSVRGGIVDIYPLGQALPVRIVFEDDTVEKIRSFSPESGLSIQSLNSAKISPAYEYDYSSINIKKLSDAFILQNKTMTREARQRAEDIVSEIIEKLKNKNYDTSLLWALPFSETKTDIFSYLKSAPVFFDGFKSIKEKGIVCDRENSQRTKELFLSGETLKEHDGAVIDFSSVEKRLKDFSVIDFATETQDENILKLNSPSVPSYFLDYDLLFKDISKLKNNGYDILLCFNDKERAQTSRSAFLKEGISVSFKSFADIKKEGFSGIALSDASIEKGFIDPVTKIAVIGKSELVRKKQSIVRRKTGLSEMPKIGDFVVHEVHGIGKCTGFCDMITDGIKRDYITVEYYGGDVLYIPVDQMTRLSRYSGADTAPALSKIGTKSFEKVKERVKESVKKMAVNLLELYAKREKAKGFIYPGDDFLQKQFEDDFEYTETPDQLQAIEDVKSDMEKGKVMDRLICGDVGYGKTEVALRAVFKTVTSSKQAAILSPTTILAKQHYNTVVKRMEKFGVKAAMLTRLQKPAEIKKTLKNLENGSIDVLVATHRMLSPDVVFKDLGLLVLDEEQRFGVEHKEKIKELKNDLNVLTMSATPIPRTLNMALCGIRDISILETSPKNRLPIDTYVTEYSDALVKDAIEREIAREGQVFILYNRVKGIEDFARHISELVKNAKIIVTHGRLSPEELDTRINAFYEKEGNILVTTTIIENGIDLPDANTLIVIDADRLGLNSLYQLRGRVGRSSRLAKAYFTVEKGKPLTKEGESRLKALVQNTELGSGMKIAMADLEIRGAGELLGREQSGHIAEVGYDLYCKLLAEAVSYAEGKEEVKETDTELFVNQDAYIDSSYIENESEKLKYYKKAASLSNKEELENLILELTELYGKPKAATVNLLKICLIKNLASSKNISRIVIDENRAELYFVSADVFKDRKIIEAVSDAKNIRLNTNIPVCASFENIRSVFDKTDAVLDFLIKIS